MQALGRAMRAAQEKSRERIVEILTPEQKSKLDALMAAERKKRGEAELDRTVAAYRRSSLNDEQREGFRAVLADGREQRREATSPASTGAQPQGRPRAAEQGDREGAHARAVQALPRRFGTRTVRR
jgi:Spy/CpxP family protein refolding chaperone